MNSILQTKKYNKTTQRLKHYFYYVFSQTRIHVINNLSRTNVFVCGFKSIFNYPKCIILFVYNSLSAINSKKKTPV